MVKQTMADALKQIQKSAKPLPASVRKGPTHAQVVAAAWGNVAAENPRVTMGDAKRAVKKG